MPITPLVSVVMATYNRTNVIERAIDSILNQTYDNFELLIVDDGCTDGTSQILEKYAAKDKRIVLLRQNNQGLAAARNAAVDKAQGKYIAFMDDDDVSLPNRLEKQVIFLGKYPDYDACTCETQKINLTEKSINNEVTPLFDIDYFPTEQGPFNNGKCNYRWYPDCGLGSTTCLTKESFINCNGYRTAGHLIIEDLDFTLRFLRKYKTAVIIGGHLYLYTNPHASFGNNLSTKDCIKFLKRHIASYISAWFCSCNMPDPVEEDLSLDEIIALITKLPKTNRYLIYKSIRYMIQNIMRTEKISRKEAEEFISVITHISWHAFLKYHFLSKLGKSVLLIKDITKCL